MATQKDVLNARVLQRMDVAPGLMIVQVAPDGWKLPEFRPGQYTMLGLPVSAARCEGSDPDMNRHDPDDIITRTYSITSSSAPHDFFEFYILLVRSGELTPRLFALRVGDPLFLWPKTNGMFTIDSVPNDQNVMLFATGTGLAPYMSMIRSSLAQHRERRLAVVHGAYRSCDLGYRSELTALERIGSHFDYIPLISDPDHEPVPWSGRTGFCQDIWRRGVIEDRWGFRPSPSDTHAFLCGHPAMIKGMIELLTADGFVEHSEQTPGQIHLEKYW
ncbi:MAG: ferredoxin--NADP reductase [Pirellulales bacterium]|nr:ferredoxin--NADP reductase [Pirellulales bacterium]